jgi:hydroxyacyl-ACP dehydratase HTD2-like protein with hotdog domain
MKLASLEIGQTLPERTHTATNVSLFMYNAAVWNHHRIHYDEIYTTTVEKHPGIVIDGPLQGDWLSQVALNWLADHGQLERFSYSNRRAAYLGETLISGGSITEIDPNTGRVELALFIKNADGDVITPGIATVCLTA